MTGLAPIPSADATAASPHFGQVGGARRGGTLLHSVSRYFHATMRCFGVDFGADAPAMGGGSDLQRLSHSARTLLFECAQFMNECVHSVCCRWASTCELRGLDAAAAAALTHGSARGQQPIL